MATLVLGRSKQTGRIVGAGFDDDGKTMTEKQMGGMTVTEIIIIDEGKYLEDVLK